MKGLSFALLASFALPMLLTAHPAPNQKTPQLEVKVQKLPSDQEGNYYDESAFDPKRPVDREKDYYNSALAPEVRVKVQETPQTAPSRPSAPIQEVPRLENPPQPNQPSTSAGEKNDKSLADASEKADRADKSTKKPVEDAERTPSTSEKTNETLADASETAGKVNNSTEKPVAGKERTLSIIKPDGVNNHHIGEIISRFEKAGLSITDIKMTTLSKEQAEQFYQEHRERPFYKDLVKSMTSGPVVLMVLEGNQAVSKNRELMGATDPSKAEKGTLRADFAKDTTQNTVHGSDSLESARKEILFFFPPNK